MRAGHDVRAFLQDLYPLCAMHLGSPGAEGRMGSGSADDSGAVDATANAGSSRARSVRLVRGSLGIRFVEAGRSGLHIPHRWRHRG